MTEAWLDKKAAAKHWACSTRSLDYAIREGMPHAVVFGRVKFLVSESQPWLEANGYLERRGGYAEGNPNGAAPLQRPAPGHEE
jgi:hypothetical protein